MLLDWATASEQNNDYFTVERSSNTVDFEAIGTVVAAGNSTTPTAYSYADAALPAGAQTLHYRIRQTDVDGQSALSETRTVTLDRSSGLAAWPNPATDRLMVRVPANVHQLMLVNATGQAVYTAETNALPATLSLDLSDLAAGVYTLRAGTAAIRVVKE